MKAAKYSTQPKLRAGRPPGRPPGRSRSDGVVADRESLLAAAERLIRRAGPGVSLDAIAIEAGVTKPILYRGVGDRHALMQALTERLNQRMTEAVEREVTAAGSAEEAVRCLVWGYLEHAKTERNLYLYVTAAVIGDDRLRQSLLLADGTARQFAASIAVNRSKYGEDPSVATVWSYGLVGALHYVTLWWLREETLDQEAVAEQLTALLWAGMKIEQAGGPKRDGNISAGR